jgi:hypothetical protein
MSYYNLVKLTDQHYLALSVAGFLFIIFDVFSHLNKEFRRREVKWLAWICGKIEGLALFFSIMAILVLPFIKMNQTNEELQRLNNFIVLSGLGLVIMLLSSKEISEMVKFIKGVFHRNNVNNAKEYNVVETNEDNDKKYP